MIKNMAINLMMLILLSSFSAFGASKEGKLSLQILSVDSPFSLQDSDNSEDPYFFTDNFYNAISSEHPPILVNYDNHKSLLLFVPANKEDPDNRSLVYNFNLANQKMNEVGRFPSNDEVLSIFGYQANGHDAMVIMLTKDMTSEYTRYSTTRFSVLKEDGGLYIQSFKTDRITLLGLDFCVDGGTDYLGNERICKYKDAASIKRFFDEMNKSD